MKYRIQWDEITVCEAIVEAESAEEALDKSYYLTPDELTNQTFDRRTDDICEVVEIVQGQRDHQAEKDRRVSRIFRGLRK